MITLVNESSPKSRSILYKAGTITNYNSAYPCDGACSLVLASETKANTLGLASIAKIIGIAEFSTLSNNYPKSLYHAACKLLSDLGMTEKQVDL